MVRILDGRKLSIKMGNSLKRKVKKLSLNLRLAVVQVGKDPASDIFIRQKKKFCQKVGIDFKLYQFDRKLSVSKIKESIRKVSRDSRNSGVIIQLPLPKKINPQEVLNLILPKKDIDVLSEVSLGKFYQGTSPILPPIVCGILRLLSFYKINLKGKNVVIMGAGRLVGNPLTLQLLQEKATVSVLNEFTKDTLFFTRKADIVISGVGKQGLIKGNMLKKGVVVIDAGTTFRNNKIVGDVDFKSVSKKASYITPVPGGVGPMTVACLIENLVRLSIK